MNCAHIIVYVCLHNDTYYAICIGICVPLPVKDHLLLPAKLSLSGYPMCASRLQISPATATSES